MKKKLILILSFVTLILVWCNDSNIKEIDTENWVSDEWLWVEKVFNQQIDEAQYIKDLEDYLSYKILSITENKPYTSKFSIDVDFDDKSPIHWWIEFSQEKYSKTNDYETSNIELSVDVINSQDDADPIKIEWALSLLYQNNWMYLELQDFDLSMWEDNDSAKMYNLMWDLLKNKWVDLEVGDWWIISLDTESDTKLQYIVWTLKNVLKTEWINEDSPNFLNGVAELIDTINWYIDLGISTNELQLVTREGEYFQLSDKSIQRVFTWMFQSKESEFTLAFTADKNWLQVHLYDIREFDGYSEYLPTDVEFIFSIKENNKSEYSVVFYSTKYQQKAFDFEWKIKYSDIIEFSANFELEPAQLFVWQRISWNVEWKSVKRTWVEDAQFPVLSGDLLSISDLLSSIWINLY